MQMPFPSIIPLLAGTSLVLNASDAAKQALLAANSDDRDVDAAVKKVRVLCNH
jgi:hypothetical protein